MSLMLKLLAITLTLSSLLGADASSEKVEKFLKDTFAANPNIKSINVKVTNVTEVKGYEDWNAYYVELDAMLKKEKRQVVQKMVWFSDGNFVTKELFDLNSGKNMSDLVSLPFKSEHYKKENLIYGNPNAKHKVAIFSDPLCPFCRTFVPEAIEYMKKEPNKFAIYYYHFPLDSLHPAAVELVKAAIALELQGKKDVVLNLYKVQIDPKEKSNEKILAEFNKVMNSNIKLSDLLSKEVSEHLKNDLELADALMVNGTPTMFFDGVMDKTKNRYKEAK
ncbi:MAG: disulfide bond formation protein DsbA [Sulfurimonas sp. RIFCSPHIGHO2_12_FULL_36_9]|nr:MAG: disulfide bond formation protein DsbA [Sulfurimonas sp. RIFCSPHIGHO2_12_FULL_36_9]OHE01021.1 MAG: disulfide bond formation protein DsbA [Sulfurimonas sp. RIFCSPLOWO2_02_FULL_36_28]OHE01446.1 MAG: disulfide bond formation protein DsbA [Sulfurimonas sp. RIFCSPLOWO2_12_FULL_36_74]OHE02255.1 MAG: disulfide bond formation protein DsbA [Sulfurimonas sp. RIFCSPLOWO2_12_36_12]